MKGTVLRPEWPTPTNKKADQKAAPRDTDLKSRITLALLDEYSEPKGKGYDPYNTDAKRLWDVWSRKPKRD